MSCRDEYGEFDDVDDDDRDDPADADMDDPAEADEPELVECPYCGKSIAEDAERCHHCGSYIVDEDVAAGRRLPVWVIIGAVLAGVGVLAWVFF